MLTGYVFTMVLLTRRDLCLAYLGLANKTLVDSYLTEISQEIQQLALASYDQKEGILLRSENTCLPSLVLPIYTCFWPAFVHR